MNFAKATREFRVSQLTLACHLLPKVHVCFGFTNPFIMPEVTLS